MADNEKSPDRILQESIFSPFNVTLGDIEIRLGELEKTMTLFNKGWLDHQNAINTKISEMKRISSPDLATQKSEISELKKAVRNLEEENEKLRTEIEYKLSRPEQPDNSHLRFEQEMLKLENKINFLEKKLDEMHEKPKQTETTHFKPIVME
jgi:chromosome segregation ATPase